MLIHLSCNKTKVGDVLYIDTQDMIQKQVQNAGKEVEE
jgi:hypothetical protein